jgi:lysine/ornithine N-monooxygenase
VTDYFSQRIEGSRVYFVGGKSEEFDKIIMCTGYRIDLPFLSENMQKLVLNKETNEIKVIYYQFQIVGNIFAACICPFA